MLALELLLLESGENTVNLTLCVVFCYNACHNNACHNNACAIELWNLVVIVILFIEAGTNVCVYTRFRLGVAGALIVFTS